MCPIFATENMGIMNTLRKLCVMKSVRDKAKAEDESKKQN